MNIRYYFYFLFRFYHFYFFIIPFYTLNSELNNKDNENNNLYNSYYYCCIDNGHFCSSQKFNSRYECLLNCFGEQSLCLLKDDRMNTK